MMLWTTSLTTARHAISKNHSTTMEERWIMEETLSLESRATCTKTSCRQITIWRMKWVSALPTTLTRCVWLSNVRCVMTNQWIINCTQVTFQPWRSYRYTSLTSSIHSLELPSWTQPAGKRISGSQRRISPSERSSKRTLRTRPPVSNVTSRSCSEGIW